MLTAAMSLTSPAFAHSDGGSDGGLLAGLLHPLTGADHLLAMLAIGVWAAQYQGQWSRRWLMLLSFPSVMALGAIAAIAGVLMPAIEPGTAGSVAVLGLLIVFAVRMSSWFGMLAVSLFALMHGYSHGMELPADASPVMYGAGFMLATLILHAIGMAATRIAAGGSARVFGAAVAAAGAYLLAGPG